jgi:hypothetical protein
MKIYVEVEGTVPSFLTSALDEGEWSDSRPSRFTPGERTVFTHLIQGWVGHRAAMGAMEKRKILTLPGIETQPSSS